MVISAGAAVLCKRAVHFSSADKHQLAVISTEQTQIPTLANSAGYSGSPRLSHQALLCGYVTTALMWLASFTLRFLWHNRLALSADGLEKNRRIVMQQEVAPGLFGRCQCRD